MSHLKSAYSTEENPDHIIVFRVPKSTFDELFLSRCPRRGVVNAVMTQLYKKFHATVIADTTIPTHYELDNDDHYQRILDGCGFGITPDNGHSQANTKRTKGVRDDKSTTPKQSSDASIKAGKRKQKTRRSKTKEDS